MPIKLPICPVETRCATTSSCLPSPPCRSLSSHPLPNALRSPRGLSRVEFCACLVVIGVLTSTLLPRISEWQQQARAIQLANAIVALNRAVVIFQAECSRSAGPCDQLVINGRTIAGANGQAAATPDGIARLAELPADTQFHEHWVDGVPALTMSLPSRGIPPCEFTYVQAPRSGSAPVIHRPPASCP
jgi:hypothetical protein